MLPLSGIAFVALVVLSIGLGGGTPDPAAPAEEVVSFYGDEPIRQKISAFVLAASMPFLLLFATSLAGFRWPGDPGSRVVWRRVLLAGSIIAAATIAVALLIHLSLADAGRGTAPDALQALNVLDGHVLYALATALGVMMLGAAGWLLGRGRIHGWLGWAALVLGVALFVPFAAFIAFLLSGVWIAIASVALVRTAAVENASA